MTGHLAFLTSQYPAATHTFIQREVQALRDLGWTIDTFSVRSPDPAWPPGEADSAEEAQTFYILRQSPAAILGAQVAAFFGNPARYLRTLGLALSHRAPGARGLFLALAHFAESAVLARELKRRRIAHLHNHFANSAATVGLLATRMLGIGWSFTMHGISETDYPAGLMLGRKIEAADMVACVSLFGRAQAMRLVGPEHWDKLTIVRCGIPFDRLPQPGTKTGHAPTIICVGRLSPEKGQAGLLRAFASLRTSNSNAKLKLVGDGPDRETLEALAREMGVTEAVTFTGRLSEDDTLAQIAQSDLLVLSSFMEGLPIVLMEAMALGVPVVASRVAGIPELVEDGSTGLLFAPSDWDGLKACMERLLGDGTLQAEIAERARKKVAEEFDVRGSAKVLAGLFERIGAGGKA